MTNDRALWSSSISQGRKEKDINLPPYRGRSSSARRGKKKNHGKARAWRGSPIGRFKGGDSLMTGRAVSERKKGTLVEREDKA